MNRATKLASRLTYPRVMAAVAILLVALGGSYSLAFSGSGTLQKENEIGVPTSATPEVIRTIKGVGEIEAFSCDVDVVTETAIQFKNTSGETLRLHEDRVTESLGATADPLVFTVADEASEIILSPGDDLVARIHAFPSDGSKTPQARIILSHRGSASTCDDVQISVLNLTTEE